MLADPRSSALADNFAGQWLEIRNLDVVKPDPQKFPEWSPELRDAMRTETRLFFDYILRENRPLADFLDAALHLPERAAGQALRHRRRDRARSSARWISTTDQRGGMLSQASVLTVSSYPTRTSVVIRGKYILNKFWGARRRRRRRMCRRWTKPPWATPLSLRQQMEKHRADAVCASCHNKMDPLGFGLENYDGIGKWRTMDGKFPVDSQRHAAQRQDASPRRQKCARCCMAQLPQFARCVMEKMLIYALGRGLAPYDRRTVDEIGTQAGRRRVPVPDR